MEYLGEYSTSAGVLTDFPLDIFTAPLDIFTAPLDICNSCNIAMRDLPDMYA